MTTEDPRGFTEVPEEYRPKRMEYRSQDPSNSLLAWAVPLAKGSQAWVLYLDPAICDDIGIGALDSFPWDKGRIRELSVYEAKKWVIGMGRLAEAWLAQ